MAAKPKTTPAPEREKVKKPKKAKASEDLKLKEEELPLNKGGALESSVPEETGEPEQNKGKEKYFQAVGRRKESIARVWLLTKKSSDANSEEMAMISVNGKDYSNYFTDKNL